MLFIFSTPLLIRHRWELKKVVFLHWCLIYALLFHLMLLIMNNLVAPKGLHPKGGLIAQPQNFTLYLKWQTMTFNTSSTWWL